MYVAATKEEVLSDKDLKATFENWISEENAPVYYPNFKQQFIYKNEEFSANLKFNLSPRGEEDNIKQYEISLKTVDGKLQDFGLYLKLETEWLPFDQRMKGTMSDFGSASIAVFKGIGTLFTGGLRNMSGIVGIYSYSAQLYGTQTFATYLYFWGLISINLAIFNLLPFPGLDGWQILVTSIEGITKKKIPSKAKTIMSFIGLALLFALMIAIVAMDVMRIVGVL